MISTRIIPGRNRNLKRRTPRNPEEVQLGITLFLSKLTKEKKDSKEGYNGVGISSQDCWHSSIIVDPKNLKGPFTFGFKLYFIIFVIFEDFSPIWWSKFNHSWLVWSMASLTNHLQYAMIVCTSARGGILRNLNWEKASPPGIACNLVETMEYRTCIAVARASSIRSTAWKHVWGCWASKSVFDTVATVWCICSKIAEFFL